MNWLDISAYYVAAALSLGTVACVCEVTIGLPSVLNSLVIFILLLAVPATMYVQLNYVEDSE